VHSNPLDEELNESGLVQSSYNSINDKLAKVFKHSQNTKSDSPLIEGQGHISELNPSYHMK